MSSWISDVIKDERRKKKKSFLWFMMVWTSTLGNILKLFLNNFFFQQPFFLDPLIESGQCPLWTTQVQISTLAIQDNKALLVICGYFLTLKVISFALCSPLCAKCERYIYIWYAILMIKVIFLGLTQWMISSYKIPDYVTFDYWFYCLDVNNKYISAPVF